MVVVTYGQLRHPHCLSFSVVYTVHRFPRADRPNKPRRVRLKDESTISLAADFNGKLRERGCLKGATVQKVCKVAKDEGEVREISDAV